MYKTTLVNWLKDALMGVDCSLLAAAFISIVTPSIDMFIVMFCLILGLAMMSTDLMLSLVIDAKNP
ncbi:hypothetical protein FHR87_003593 [Azomonas macrocytogenes]|uniref:Uncharacterized protein n=1 Tax=Azomonas macrocytogenes TaxID=69962 RepID=A0A839T7U3_AZOMA|nr:hypothetical protein [Azomonas macrocytogenes]